MGRPVPSSADSGRSLADTPAQTSGERTAAVQQAPRSFDPLQRPAVDLGVGSHWRSVAGTGAGVAAADDEPSVKTSDSRETARAIERSIRESLTARDVELGLGRAGPLVSAAHDAASSPEAPEIGTTILEVESDAAGNVVAIRSDDRAWSQVAAAVVRRMAGKPLRVRTGARGVRARVRIVAERALPAGGHTSASPGAVPDDVAGGSKACVGQGVTRRCIAGMPVGVTGSAGDTSNIGAHPTRVVHVQLVAENER